ncbi:MAG: hypothetical protein CVU17_11175 [Betaproteobacteria bacterium HGW-Betaproteobacteria-11]|nr:MAG: hypothetical protein CVU17_11175 [Betaproteobacteria bacterium HGW-Betaproteobacteria-11]
MIDNLTVAPVSVVIPCYRCSGTIERALASVAAQTHRPAEVLLVDDGSNDDTLGVLKALERQYSEWVRVLSLPFNKGPSAARNVGWNAATQPYIAFLDADDVWHPEKIRIQRKYMSLHKDVAACGHHCPYAASAFNAPIVSDTEPTASVISPVSLLFRNPFSTPTVMLKKDLPVRFTGGHFFAEDLRLWQQLAFAGYKTVRLEIALAYILKHPYGDGGLSARLWAMEKGELDNLLFLKQQRKIGAGLLSVSILFSLLKYVRRLIVCKIFR